MNKTVLVMNHEFHVTIRRVGFIIMTLIVPLIAILGIGIYQIISGAAAPTVEIKNVGYVDEVGGFDRYTQQGNVQLVKLAAEADAVKALADGNVQAYIIITPDYYNTGVVQYFNLEKQLFPPAEVSSAIKTFLSGNLMAGKLPDSTIALINSSLNLVPVRITETGEISTEQGGVGDLIVPVIFGILLMMSISFSSSYLLAGLGDEKENRLIEILLSSVSTRQLIIGKVLGLGMAGLLQVIVWVLAAPLVLNMATSSIGGILGSIQITPVFLILFVVYFILGYLVFAVIFTALGAISTSAREGQQLSTIFTLASVSPLWFVTPIILFPNNPAFIALTIFPLTAPVTLMLRLGATEVPAWQIIVSVLVLLVSIIGGLFLTAKIVRTFLLMYGKRPGLKEIVRSLRAG